MRPFLLTVCLLASAPALGQESDPRPNILVILADDAGVELFPAWGGTAHETPHLDALVDSGLRFRHAHSHPLCTPSRIALMTGQRNDRNYVEFGILDPSARTFADELREAGYRTAVVGKWQLYGPPHYKEEWQGKGTRPEDAGFDRWCLWQVEQLGKRYQNPSLEVDGEWRPDLKGEYGPDLFCEYALRFMAEERQEPFLLYYPMALPHAPFTGTPDVPQGAERDERFAGMVTYIDDVLGRLVTGLEAHGLRERTLVLFTCDNGTDAAITTQRGVEAVQGGKSKPILRGTHVPMVASWPGTVPAGADYDELVDFTDLYPTLCGVAGITLPAERELDGMSFAPQLRGDPGVPRRVSAVYYNPRPRIARLPERMWAHTKHFKLYSTGQLFDLRSDPEELAPLDLVRLDPLGRRELPLLVEALGTLEPWPRAIPREVIEAR